MDINTNAFRIVRESTGQAPKKSIGKSKAGKLGGAARAKSLSKLRRKQIALKAVRTRWGSRTKEQGQKEHE